MVASYQVFIYHGNMLPSVSLCWLHVTQCFFIMVTCYPVFLYYGYMLPSVSLLWAHVAKCFFYYPTTLTCSLPSFLTHD